MSDANKKAAQEKKSLEAAINALIEKNEDFENKIHKILAENDRLANIIKDKTAELETQKTRFQTFEKNKTEELEQMKDFYEEKLKRDLVSKFITSSCLLSFFDFRSQIWPPIA